MTRGGARAVVCTLALHGPYSFHVDVCNYNRTLRPRAQMDWFSSSHTSAAELTDQYPILDHAQHVQADRNTAPASLSHVMAVGRTSICLCRNRFSLSLSLSAHVLITVESGSAQPVYCVLDTRRKTWSSKTWSRCVGLQASCVYVRKAGPSPGSAMLQTHQLMWQRRSWRRRPPATSRAAYSSAAAAAASAAASSAAAGPAADPTSGVQPLFATSERLVPSQGTETASATVVSVTPA